MKIFNLIFLFILINSGCKENTNILEISRKGNLEFQISQNESFSFYQYVFDGTSEYVVCIDTSTVTLNFYNLNNGSLEHYIPLTEGTTKFNKRLNDIYIISKDSILLINSHSNKLFLLDSNGNKKHEWVIENLPQQGNYNLFSAGFSSLEFKNNRVFCGIVRTDIRLNNKQSLKEYYNSPTNIILIIKDGDIESTKSFGIFPEAYTSEIKDMYDFTPSRAISQDKIILSFNKDHNIYIYNVNGELIKKVNSKSKYIENFNEMEEAKSSDFSYLKEFLTKEPKYERILYDSHYDLYYRIAKHSLNEYYRNDGTKKSFYDNEYSIIILDKNLNFIDEVIFESKKYFVPGLIPTKNGLLLPLFNDNEEKRFTADLFEIKFK